MRGAGKERRASRRVRADGASPSRDAWPGEGIAGCFGTGGAIRPEQNAPPFSWAGRGVSVSTKRAHLCGDAGRGGQPLPQFVDKGRLRGPLSTGHVSPAPWARPGKRAGKPCCAKHPNPARMSPGSDSIGRASVLQTSQWGFRRSGLPMRRQLGISTNGTHFSGDAGRGGQPLPISSAAAACTPPGAAASRFRYHVPPVRFAHRNIMSPSLQG